MKKSNVILTAVLAAASIFLLWLWFALGFNEVDSPLDLAMSIGWWAIIAAGGAFVVKTEKTRQERLRTVYLADGQLFNSEVGLRSVLPGASATDTIAAMIGSLEYGFDKVEGPDPAKEEERVDWRYVIHTSKFESKTDDDGRAQRDRETWEGDVVTVATGDKRAFSSRAELAALIA